MKMSHLYNMEDYQNALEKIDARTKINTNI